MTTLIQPSRRSRLKRRFTIHVLIPVNFKIDTHDKNMNEKQRNQGLKFW